MTIGEVPQIPDRGNATFDSPYGVPIADLYHMTNGVSNVSYFYGGTGDDYFEVNHNVAELYLFGQEDDDTFVINTFLVLNEDPDDPGSITNLARLFGGEGSNRYQYLQNAPVNIFGGPGIDTVVINGTAIGDTFIITDKFVAGAGRIVPYTGIERLVVNGAGGRDDIYILSSPAHLEITIAGGTGEDNIHLGGDHPTLFFDPPAFTYDPPSYAVQDEPVIVYDSLTWDPGRYSRRLSWWGSRSLWDFVQDVSNYGTVNDYVGAIVTDWMNEWYEQNKENWRYIDIKYPGGLNGLIAQTLSSIRWRFSWGRWWLFDPYINFSFDVPEVTIEYGVEDWPPPRTVFPPAITIDPDPFALKVPGVTTLDGIRGAIKIDGGEDSNGSQDLLIVHAQGSTSGLTGSLVNTTESKTSTLLTISDTSGTYVLSDGTSGVELQGNATASDIQSALERFPSIGAGGVVVTDGSSATIKQINFVNSATPPTLTVLSGSAAISSDVVTTEYLNLTGLGLTSGAVNGRTFNGVLLQNLENIDLLLGNHPDQFTINATPIADASVTTRLSLGGGADQVTISSLTGETTILGGAGNDSVRLNADQSSVPAIVSNLIFDGNGEIFEQSTAIPYYAGFHQPIIDAVPTVITQTTGGTVANPAPQFNEKILTADRTAHVTLLGTTSGSVTSGNISKRSQPLDLFWTQASAALTGAVAGKWVLVLDGQGYEYVAQNDDSLADVALGLDAAVNSSSFSVSVNSNRDSELLVSKTGGAPFTVQVIRGFERAAEISGTLSSDVTQFELRGPVSVGSVWSISTNLNGSAVTATRTVSSASETLRSIAANLVAQLGAAARVDRYLDLYVVEFDPISGLPAKDIIQRRGRQARGYLETGYQLKGYALYGRQELNSQQQPLFLNPDGSKTTSDTGVQSIEILNPTAPSAVPLFEDVLHNLTTVNAGKQVFVIDQANSAADELFFDGLGRLTTSDTGVPVLQISQNSNTVLPFYYDGQLITTRKLGARLTVAEFESGVPLANRTPMPLRFNQNGAKVIAEALTDRGYQLQGYQQYGYLQFPANYPETALRNVKSTTSIAIGANLVENFDDAYAVPLYQRFNDAGSVEITTERIAGSPYTPPSNGQIDPAYEYFKATHPGFTGPLYRYFSSTGAAVVTDDPFEGLRPYIKPFNGGNSVSGHPIVPLYFDANGNLTTENTGDLDWRVGFQRTNANSTPLFLAKTTDAVLTITGRSGQFVLVDGTTAVSLPWNASGTAIRQAVESFASTGGPGHVAVNPIPANFGDTSVSWRITITNPTGMPNLGVLTGPVATMGSVQFLTPNQSDAYRQAIVVVNDLVYRDGGGNRTLDPTNHAQEVITDNQNSSGRAVALYQDADGNLTTLINNPAIVVTNSSSDAPLYNDKFGAKTLTQTPNRLYAATSSNTAPLIYSDNQGLDVQSALPLPVPRVFDNGQNPGTAIYNVTQNQKATIETLRQRLIVGTRPFQMVRNVADAGIDTLNVSATGGVSQLVLDDVALVGLNLGQLEFSNLEAINLTTGGDEDMLTVTNTITGSVSIHAGGGDDEIFVERISGPTAVYGDAQDDTINVGSQVAQTGDVFGDDDSTLNQINQQLKIYGGVNAGDTSGTNDVANLDDAGDLVANHGILSDQLVSGLSPGVIEYHGLDQLNLYLGKVNNTLDIVSTFAGTDVTVTGRDGGGTYNVGSNTSSLLDNLGWVNDIRSRVELVAGAGVLETQQITIGQNVTGTLALRLPNANNSGSTRATQSIAITSDSTQNAAAIQSALNSSAVLGVGAVSVSVSSSVPGAYDIAFSQLGNFSEVEILSSSLRDSSNSPTNATVTTTREGLIDQLNFDDRQETTDRSDSRLEADRISGFGMSGTGIVYTGFESLHMGLGSGNDSVFVLDTHAGETNIDLGDESITTGQVNDRISLRAISGTTRVYGGNGNDEFLVNYEADFSSQTNENNLGGVLWLHGRAGGDVYRIGLAGTGSALIHVLDESNGDLGVDSLIINGTLGEDTFFLRPNAVSSVSEDMSGNRTIERINYDGSLNGGMTINGRDGNDTFVLDDNNIVTTIYGDAGQDTFQVGQVFQSPRDANAGLQPEDTFPTTLTTRGYLSNGISRTTTLFGGTGNDSFTVYHNQADLAMRGDEDDDTFTVRAFVRVDPNDTKAPRTNINGGQGADFISYTVNLPVDIEGGDGFDTLTVVGTEFGDDFVVNDKGVFGAGLFVRFSGLERVVVDALEGNDNFYIGSTSKEVDLQLVGGRGSDTFNVGGSEDGEPITVVSNDGKGSSGLIDMSMIDGTFVSDVSANVFDNDTAGVVITPIGSEQLRVFEEVFASSDARSSLVFDGYEVMLTRPPTETVYVTAAPILPKESERRAGGQGLALRKNGDTGPFDPAGITLAFDRTNWYVPQTIQVSAPDDFLAEGIRVLNIAHSVQQGAVDNDGGEYDGARAARIAVEAVDNDVSELLIAPAPGETVVIEGGSAIAYKAVMTRAPASDITVFAGIREAQRLFLGQGTTGNLTLSTPSALDPAVTLTTASITVTADATQVAAAIEDALNDGAVLGSGAVTVTAVPRHAGHYDILFADTADFPQITIQSQNLADSMGPVTANASTLIDGNGGSLDVTGGSQLTFSTSGTGAWNIPQAIGLTAVDDTVIEGIHYARIPHVIDPLDVDAFRNLSRQDAIAGLLADIQGDVSGNYTVTQAKNMSDTLLPRITVQRGLQNGGGFVATTGPGVTFTGIENSLDWLITAVIDLTVTNPSVPAPSGATPERWSLALDGLSLGHTLQPNDTAWSVASSLVNLINSSGIGFTASSVNGSSSTQATISISRSDSNAFQLQYSDSSSLQTKVVTAVTNPGTSTLDGGHWSSGVFDLGGTTTDPILSNFAASLQLNGVPYDYAASADQRSLRVDPIDVTIADDDTQVVLVNQPLGSTDVIEPTDRAILGSGKVVSETVDGAVLTLTRTGAVFESADITINQPSSATNLPEGRYTVDISPDKQTLRIALSGAIQQGEVWNLTVRENGSAYVYKATIGTDTSLFALAEALEQDITSKATSLPDYSPSARAVTQLVGAFGTPILYSNGENHTLSNAQPTDFASWSDGYNPELFDGTQPNSTEHLTVKGIGDGELDYYSFTISPAMLEQSSKTLPGSTTKYVTATFDVDHGFERTDATVWGSQLRLYNDQSRLLAVGRGWSPPSVGGTGSSTWLDDYLTYNFTAPGTYTIGISNWIYWLNNYSSGIPEGVNYDLQISIENHPVSDFIFAPEPVAENDSSRVGQSLEDSIPNGMTYPTTGDKWFTFYNSDIGNSTIAAQGTPQIDSSTPYVVVNGTGDGRIDTYTFAVTPEMLRRPAGTVNSGGTVESDPATQSARVYYTSANLALTGGTPATGDQWTLAVNGKDYVYTVLATDQSLADVAAGIQAIVAQQKPLEAPYEVNASNGVLSISDESGFWFDLTHDVANAATVMKTGVVATDSSGAVTFSDATVTLERTGQPEVGETWTIQLDGSQTASYTWTGSETYLTITSGGNDVYVLTDGTQWLALPSNANAAELELALETLTSIPANSVFVTEGQTANVKQLRFSETLLPAPTLSVSEDAGASLGGSTVQPLLTVSGTSGVYVLTDGSSYEVLPWNADASAITAALQRFGQTSAAATSDGLGGYVIANPPANLAVSPMATAGIGPVTSGGELGFIATELAAILDGVSGYAASATGASVQITKSGGFSVEFSKSGPTSEGRATVSGTPVSADNAKWTDVSFNLTAPGGAASSFEDWSVTLTTSAQTHTLTHHVSLGGEPIDTVGQSLRDQLNHSSSPFYNVLTATYDAANNILRIFNDGSTRADAFTATASVVAGTQGAINPVQQANVESRGVEVSGSVAAGTWKVTAVDASSGTVYEGSYLADGTESNADVAMELADNLNLAFNVSGFRAASDGNALVASNLQGQSFTLALKRPFSATTRGVTLSGTPSAGQVWAVSLVDTANANAVINTATYVVTGAESGTPQQQLATIATQLANQLQAGGFAAASDGASLVVSHATQTAFDLIIPASGEYSTPVSHDIVLTGNPVAGQVWAVQLDDPSVPTAQYQWTDNETLSGGQTKLNYIATQLASQLSTNGYTASAVGDSVAVSKPGATFTLTDVTGEYQASSSEVISLSGTEVAGQWWQVNLFDSGTFVRSAAYQWLGTEGQPALPFIAMQLANELDSLTNYSAKSVENQIVVTGGTSLELRQATLVPDVSTNANATGLKIEAPAASNNGQQYEGKVIVQTPSAATAGSVWQFVVTDGSATRRVRYTVTGNASASNIASQLLNRLGSTFTLNGHTYAASVGNGSNANEITIETTYGNSTTAASSFTISVASNEGSFVDPTHASLRLAGTPSDGRVWAVRLSGDVLSASYEWLGTESLAGGQSALEYIAEELATSLDGNQGYTATALGEAIVISKQGAANFTLNGATVASDNPLNHGVTLTGAPTDGQVWSLKVSETNPFAASYTWGSNPSSEPTTSAAAQRQYLAGQLADQLRRGNYAAEAVGESVFIHNSSGSYTLAGNPLESGVAGITTLTTDGLSSNGVADPWRVVAIAGSSVLANELNPGTLDGLTLALNSALPTGYAASHDGSNVFLTRIGSGAIDVYLSKPLDVGSAAATLSTLDGVGIANEVWTISDVDSVSTNTPAASHTVTDPSESLASIAGLLAAQLDASLGQGYAVYTLSDRVIVTHVGSSTVPAYDLSNAYVAPPVAGAQVVSNGTALLNWEQQIGFDPAGNNSQIGDEWNVTVDGALVGGNPHAATANGIPHVTDYYAGQLQSSGYVVSGNGTPTLTLQSSDFGELAIDRVTETRFTPDTESTLPATNTHYTAATISLEQLPQPSDNEVWTVTLNGVEYSVTTSPRENLASIASRLAQKIDTQFGGLYDTSAYVTGSIEIPLAIATGVSSWFTGFSVEVDAGGGTVQAVFDIDHASYGEGSRSFRVYEPVVINGVYQGYSAFQDRTVSFTAIPYLVLEAVDGVTTFQVSGADVTRHRIDQLNTPTALADPNVIDPGSFSALDPFMEVVFTNPGFYKIQVGSFVDWEDNSYNFVDKPNEGVYAGTAYDLNISLQRHLVNSAAIDLVGKDLTVVEGLGLGNSAKIVAYDAQSNTYTLDQKFNSSLDATSGLEFSYSMRNDLSYVPQGESYSVVLSKNPGTDTAVNVVPRPTRTYNASLAFDPDSDFGQNEAVQVTVATPQAEIELTGEPTPGEVWLIRIDAVEVASYQWTGNETLSAGQTPLEYIADQFRSQLADKFAAGTGDPNYNADFSVSGSETRLVIETYTKASNQTFNADFAIKVDSNAMPPFFATTGGGELRTTKVVAWSGNVTEGEVWQISLDGTDFEYEVGGSDDVAAVARGLQIKIGSDTQYTATVRNRRLTIYRVDGADFTLSATPGSQGKATISSTTTVELTGETTIGETWTLTLDDDTNNAFSHVVGFGDDLAAVASELQQLIDASSDYRASVLGRVIRITSSAAVSQSVSAALNIDKESLGGATITPQLKFTSANWSIPQQVRVDAIDDNVKDGGDAKVLASLDRQRVNVVRGPITLDGGLQVIAETFLTDPLMLPGENNFLLADGALTDAGTISGQASITDANATYVDPIRGVMPGFDPRIDEFTYSFTFFDLDSRQNQVELTSDRLASTTIAVKVEDETDTLTTTATGTLAGTGNVGTLYSKATVKLEGFVSANQIWSIIVDNKQYAYTTNANDGLTLFAVAEQLATQIRDDISGEYADTQSNGQSIEIDGAAASFTVTLGNGTGRITGTPVSPSGLHWKLVEIPIAEQSSGVYAVTIEHQDRDSSGSIVQSTSQTFTYTAVAGDTLQDVVNALASIIDEDDHYHAAVKYDTVVLSTGWDSAIPQPTAGSGYFFTPLNPNITANEDLQVDVLNLLNNNSPADDVGWLTEDRIYGLGMGPDVYVGDRLIQGGITYQNIESLNIHLGSGNDTFTVLSTHAGTTSIYGADGSDTFHVETLYGPTLIDTGAAADTINVGGQRQTVDEIAGLLTIFGGLDSATDELNIDDSNDTEDNVGTLTNTSLTGLGMPSLAEQQVLTVRAAEGLFTLAVNGVVTLAGVETSVVGSVVLDAKVTETDLATALNGLFGSSGIRVVRQGEAYIVNFGGDLAGQDVPELYWDETAVNTLVAAPDSSVDVDVVTRRVGTRTAPTQVIQSDSPTPTLAGSVIMAAADRLNVSVNGVDYTTGNGLIVDTTIGSWALTIPTQNQLPDGSYDVIATVSDSDGNVRPNGTIQTLEVNSSATATEPFSNRVQTLSLTGGATGSFRLKVLGVWTDEISVQATESEFLQILQPILDPDNSDPTKSYTRNVSVSRHGDRFVITFRGAHGGDGIQAVDSSLLSAGAVRLASRRDGINYFDIETLNIDLGSGSDTFDVLGTSAETTVNTHLGNDVLNVSFDPALITGALDNLLNTAASPSVINGSLDNVLGTLTLDAGFGSNTLNVSDFGDPDADTNVVLTENSLNGLAPATINYEATGGTFGGGVNIWAGLDDDTINIPSVNLSGPNGLDGATITTVYGNRGDDNFWITAADDLANPAHLTLGDETLRRLDILGLEGSDVIDASHAGLAVRAFAGEGRDIVKGGYGDDIIFGGTASDILFGGEGDDFLTGEDVDYDVSVADDILVGDHGSVTYQTDTGSHEILSFDVSNVIDTFRPAPTNKLLDVRATTLQLAGKHDDTILASDGNDLVLGGLGVDTIHAGDGNNLVFGDNGYIAFVVDDGLRDDIGRIVSTDTDQGAGDLITTGLGVDIVIGGSGADRIVVHDCEVAGTEPDAGNLVLGDHGQIIAAKSNESPFGNGALFAGVPLTLGLVMSTSPGIGGNDAVHAGAGNDIILAGISGDTLETATSGDFRDVVDAGDGNNLVLGDSGLLVFAQTLDNAATTAEISLAVDPTKPVDATDPLNGGVPVDTETAVYTYSYTSDSGSQ